MLAVDLFALADALGLEPKKEIDVIFLASLAYWGKSAGESCFIDLPGSECGANYNRRDTSPRRSTRHRVSYLFGDIR